MAEDLSALELVPRGVEGTGKAVVLGNEPVVQSLARLSSRMDNLQRLKLYADAKRAQAKQKEVKQEYDKTPFPVGAIEGGVLGGWNTAETEKTLNNLLQQFQSKNPTEKQPIITKFGLEQAKQNSYVKNVNAALPKVQDDIYKLGYNTGTTELANAEKAYLQSMDVAANQYARENNITDPDEIRKLRNNLVVQNNFVDFYANRVKTNPENIDLNRFGKRIYDVLGETSRQVIMPDGTGMSINRNNLLTEKGNLDTEKLKLAINADSEDSRMFNLATTQYLKSAANTTGDKKAADAVKALFDNNFDLNKLSTDEQNLISNKVMPAAQNAVLQRMFAGKGKFETKSDLLSTKQREFDIELGKAKAGETSSYGPMTVTVTTKAVTQGPSGPVVQKDASGRDVVLELPNINLGNVQTKTLTGSNKFRFNTGSRMYFTGAVSDKNKALLGKPSPTGSYLSFQPFETSNASVIENDVYATQANPEFKATSGKVFNLPKGTIVNAGTYGAKPIGRRLALIDADDYIKTLNERDQEKIRKSGEDFKGVKIIISTDDNPQFLSKFDGQYSTPKKTQANRSITRLKNIK